MDPSHAILDASARSEPILRPTSGPPADMEHPTLQSALNEPSAELRFEDFLDVINPLQHIPIVSSIYRAITGDEIAGPAKVMGGALFGGPLGFVAGIIDAIATQINGEDLGETAVAALFGGEDAGEAPSPVLAAEQDAPAPALVALATSTGAASTGNEMPALTGGAALQALAADLRGASSFRVLPVVPADPDEAPSREGAIAQDRPMALPAASGFTLQMLDGLDKYRALAAANEGAQSTVRQRLDESF